MCSFCYELPKTIYILLYHLTGGRFLLAKFPELEKRDYFFTIKPVLTHLGKLP